MESKEFKDTILFHQIEKTERDSSGRAFFRIRLKNIPTDEELQEIKKLIDQSFYVVNETGKTPKQLVEENEKMRNFISGYCAGEYGSALTNTVLKKYANVILQSLKTKETQETNTDNNKRP